MIIYKVTNLYNNKIYIGQTTHSLNHRKNVHYKDAKYHKEHSCYFHLALLKYPVDFFKWEIIEEVNSIDELNNREIYWIKFYDSTNKEKGYNLKLGGANGGFASEELKIKLKNITIQRWNDRDIATKMLEALNKGTKTRILKSLNHFIIKVCKNCNQEFKYRPRDFNYIPKFCSNNCRNEFMHNQALHNIQRINNIKIIQQKLNNEKNIQLINNWVANNFYRFVDDVYKYRKIIFNELKALFNVKQERTILKMLNVTKMSDFIQILSKIYAEQVRNNGSILDHGKI